jgi:hypothetical protein
MCFGRQLYTTGESGDHDKVLIVSCLSVFGIADT